MKCLTCGEELEPRARICGNCGAPAPVLPAHFRALEDHYLRLQELLADGRITRAAFSGAMAERIVHDDMGNPWTINPDTGAWQIYSRRKWVSLDPFVVLPLEPAAPAEPQAAQMEVPAPATEAAAAPGEQDAIVAATIPAGIASAGPSTGGERAAVAAPPPVAPEPAPTEPGSEPAETLAVAAMGTALAGAEAMEAGAAPEPVEAPLARTASSAASLPGESGPASAGASGGPPAAFQVADRATPPATRAGRAGAPPGPPASQAVPPARPWREWATGAVVGAVAVILLLLAVLAIRQFLSGTRHQPEVALAPSATAAPAQVGAPALLPGGSPPELESSPSPSPEPPVATSTPEQGPAAEPSTGPTSPPEATDTLPPQSDTPSPTAEPTWTATDTPSPEPTSPPTATRPPRPTATPGPTPTRKSAAAPARAAGRIYYSANKFGIPELRAIDAATGAKWTILDYARQPDVRSDGRIVFDGTGGGRDNLWAINPDGSSPLAVSMHTEDSYPNWSPSSISVAFDSALQGDGVSRIYVQSDASVPEEPTLLRIDGRAAAGRFATWLPDWRIAFTGCDYWLGGANCGIWATASDGSSQGALLSSGGEDRATDAFGSVLLYASPQKGNWEIYALPLSGGQPRNLTNSPSQDAGAVFSPDGKSVAFISDRAGWSIWIMNADGSNPRKLVDVPEGFGTNWQEERLAWGP